MVGPTARLVELLRDLARTGRTPVRCVDEHPAVRWFHDLPPGVVPDVEAGPGDVVLSIDPVDAEPAPPPPDEIAPWIDLAGATDSNGGRPGLSDAVPDDVRATAERAFATWAERWDRWAEADQLVAPRRSWYDELSRAKRHLDQQDDLYELVIGTGLLTWTTDDGTVRHPLLTTPAALTTDAATGRIDVVVAGDAATTLGDRRLLDGREGFDGRRAGPVHDEVRSSAARPLSAGTADLLGRWRSLALDRALPYDDSWHPSAPDERGPELRFAPVLVLRERDRSSLIDYYDRMLEALSGPDAVAPLGLAQLLGALEPEDRLAWLALDRAAGRDASGGSGTGDATVDGVVAAGDTDAGDTSTSGPDARATSASTTSASTSATATAGSATVGDDEIGDDPLFPLPANAEQRQVADRLRHDNGVVVLGPPGTGKTHTIANLVSSLLARGQRVLVTSQKAQALRVLRDKLPDEVQKLCVSMTDVGRGGSRELDDSVTALSDRYSTFSAATHAEEVRQRSSARDAARRRVDDLTERIRLLRESETVNHPPVARGYLGTKARMAERLHLQAARCDWMPVPVPPTAPVDAPLAVDEVSELRHLLATRSPERADRLHQVLPDMTAVPTAVAVRTLVEAEAAAAAAALDVATEVSDALGAVDPDDLEELRASVQRSHTALHALGLDADPATWPDDWRTRALGDLLARRETAAWQHLHDVAGHAREVQRALGSVGLRTVALPPFAPEGPDSVAGQLAAGRAVRDHLVAGGALRHRFRPAVQRRAARLLDGAAVDGSPVSDLDQLDCVLAALDAEHTAGRLGAEWAAVGVEVDASLPAGRRIARLVDLADALDQVLAVATARNEAEQRLAGRQVRVRLTTPGEWSAFAAGLHGVEARLAADRATATLDELAAHLALDARAPAAPPELDRMAVAAAGRDVEGYQDALMRLAMAFTERADQQRCDQLEARLRAAHPALADQLAATADDDAWDDRLAVFEDAWAWGRARTFFDGLREPGLGDRLATELADAVDQVGRTTAALAAEEAWGRCLLRMTAHQEQALRSYRAHIDERGSGHGRWAGRFAAAAREAMVEARDAVPAWIMPLREVVETIPPDQNSFDVVIIDEASQAGIEALFLLWLAPRVIVVGDERQCAPSQVVRGELQPIFDRLDDYLADVPEYLRLAFTPKSNLFSLLQTRFGTVIRLREHFRCMPEIIEWSSQQFYADAPLVPLRQFGADRLPPLRTVHVAGASTEGDASRVRNLAEARALAAQVAACVADPDYDGRTMGVVVLQGSGQVRLIEDLLTEQVPAAEWEKRRLRVGSPPDFQGDERDVIFASMVIAERRRAVTARDWQRRYNVAASRARDQLWLFHSVTLDDLAPTDLRRSLLAYAQSPPAPPVHHGLDDVGWDSERRDPFESKFHQRVFVALRDKGYRVEPQVEVNGRRIDLVVTGSKARLAVECDSDHWHARRDDQLADLDHELQLRRAGWQFWRVRESEFHLDADEALASLWPTLAARGIEPGDWARPTLANATSVRWEAVALSDEEGLDGLDGADPAALDLEVGEPLLQ